MAPRNPFLSHQPSKERENSSSDEEEEEEEESNSQSSEQNSSDETEEDEEDAGIINSTPIPQPNLSDSKADSEGSPSDYKMQPISAPADSKRRRVEGGDGLDSAGSNKMAEFGEKKSSATPGGCIMRLWSNEDEIAVLNGMIDFMKVNGAEFNSEAFYDSIKGKLNLGFSREQLRSKISRLKKRFMNAAKKGDPVFSKPHEVMAFELSKKIWGGAINDQAMKEERVAVDDENPDNEEGEFWSKYPYFSESFHTVEGSAPSVVVMSFLKEKLSLIGDSKAKEFDDKWKQLIIEKTELEYKMMCLMAEQVYLALNLGGPTSPFRPSFDRRDRTRSNTRPELQPSNVSERQLDLAKVVKEREARERKEETNRKIASQKAISIILRREATKAVIEKKKGNSKKLLPRTVLEALHERITALRWESALKVFELLREQLWYKPNTGIYIKLIVMLGKCKQPEKAHTLFQAMVDEGCVVDREVYTALMSAYSRSGSLDKAFSILELMKKIYGCQPDVFTYSILIKSCLQVCEFGKAQSLLSDMKMQGIRPNTITYNTLIDAYGKAKMFIEMESVLVLMLRQRDCQPDVWTMNSTLRAFGGSGQIEMMEKCYDKFQRAGIEPTIKTFNILLDSYGKTGNYEKMSAVMQYMQKYHFSWTLITYNIVIDAFGKAGDIKQMEFLFRLMQSERIKPNCVTLCSLVRAYGTAGKAEKIAAVLRFVDNSDVMLDTVFFNCLVDAYGMMGCFSEMKGVIEMMKRRGCNPDKITYRTMIKAYSMSRMTSHAKELQRELASL